MAAFQNPEFYKKQSMRLSTALTPRVIACAEEFPQHIALCFLRKICLATGDLDDFKGSPAGVDGMGSPLRGQYRPGGSDSKGPAGEDLEGRRTFFQPHRLGSPPDARSTVNLRRTSGTYPDFAEISHLAGVRVFYRPCRDSLRGDLTHAHPAW